MAFLTGQLGLRARSALARLRCERGFSLPELLTVLVILGVILAGLTSVFVSASTAQIDLNRRFEAQQEARLALDRVRREVHCASGISSFLTNSVTLTLPTGCPTGAGSVTLCTRTIASQRYGFYRVAGSSCTGGTKYADYLTTAAVFTSIMGSGLLPKLGVVFPVDLTPDDTQASYRLSDDIVLRNGTRA